MISQLMRLRFCLIFCVASALVPVLPHAQTIESLTEPGRDTFEVPARVYEVTVEAWGAGGSGQGGNDGGGGGGAYSKTFLEVNPGTFLSYEVGAGAQSDSNSPGGDSWFGGRSLLLAKGGDSATSRSGALGGRSQDGVGAERYSGGNGAAGSVGIIVSRGGGGGSSADFGENGMDGVEWQGADAPGEGGDGGDAGGSLLIFGGDGDPGDEPGGGGGGGGSFRSGGAGANGQIRLTYQALPVPSCSAAFDSENGENPRLSPEERLDLSVFNSLTTEPWPSNNVIPAGAHSYPSRSFSNKSGGITVDGQAQVVVEGNLSIDDTNFNINADGNARDLLLIVKGNLTVNKPNVTINAVVYVTGDINLGNNAAVVGALAAHGDISIGGGKSNVTYDPNAINQVDFGGACIPDEPAVALDHIRIVHPGIGLTCQASDLEVLACADSACSSLYPEPVSITLQPAGWLPSQNVTVSGTADLQFQRSSEETVTLGISNASPAPENGAVCLAPDGSGTCDITFRDAGFVFELPDLVAGVDDSFTMAALERDEQTGECKELFARETRTVDFGTTYLNPGPVDREAAFPTYINSEAVASDGTSQTGVAVTFNDNGVAELSIRYDDAGRNSLTARYVEENQPDGGTLLIGGTADYVAVPYGLCLVPEQQCSVAGLDCGNTLPAGVPFGATPRAYRYSADVDSLSCSNKLPAPSFAAVDVPVSYERLFPSGGVDGDLLEAALDYGDGQQLLTLTEVGVFALRTAAVQGGYLGRDLPASDTARTARMVPDQLVLTIESDGELRADCGGFAYTGQTFGWQSFALPELHVEALNGQTPPQRTLNYTDPDVIGQLSADRFVVAVPDIDSTAKWNDSSSTPVPVRTEPDYAELKTGVRDKETDGVVRYRFNETDRFIYPKSAASRIGPYQPDLTFLLAQMTDSDGVNVSGIPTEGLAINPSAAFPVRYGRLTPQNVYGPENIDELAMPLQMEYWDGSRFVLNGDDSCTAWNTVNITGITADHHELATASGNFSGGIGGPLILEPTGSEGTDTLTWGGVENWQRDDLDGDGLLDAPRATATFGVYRGNDRIIYWREVTD